jgi:hypothetical protein
MNPGKFLSCRMPVRGTAFHIPLHRPQIQRNDSEGHAVLIIDVPFLRW